MHLSGFLSKQSSAAPHRAPNFSVSQNFIKYDFYNSSKYASDEFAYRLINVKMFYYHQRQFFCC